MEKSVFILFPYLTLFLATITLVSCAYDPEVLFEKYFAELPEALRTGLNATPAADPTVDNYFKNYVYLDSTNHTYIYTSFNDTFLEGCSRFNVSQFDLVSQDLFNQDPFIVVNFQTDTKAVVFRTNYETELHFWGRKYNFRGWMAFTSTSYRRNVLYTVDLNTDDMSYFMNNIKQSGMNFARYSPVIEYEVLPPSHILDIFESHILDSQGGIATIAYDAFAKAERRISPILLDEIQQRINSSLPLEY